jgi:hypothetical protein
MGTTEAESTIGKRAGGPAVKDNRLLDGRAVRDRILNEVAERVRAAASRHTIGRPGLDQRR